ncbi:MAG: copper resistance protein NlpE N-terminal domain-containing protein [Fibrobacter sp.]|nr:copper resistance protein NlpE N-terminal domain-containing protein [Fibrobacter sp.]
MKNLNSKVYSFLKMVAPVAMVSLFVSACSEEKKEPLPELPAIELPKELPGLYSGRMPCDDCSAKMIRMNLNEDMSVVVVQTKIQDSLTIDTLSGTYVVTDSTVNVSLSENSIHWNYKRGSMGTLSYLTSNGAVYEDENGLHADLIRIFKSPAKKAAAETKTEPGN